MTKTYITALHNRTLCDSAELHTRSTQLPYIENAFACSCENVFLSYEFKLSVLATTTVVENQLKSHCEQISFVEGHGSMA